MTNPYYTKDDVGNKQMSRVPSNESKRTRFSLCGCHSTETDPPNVENQENTGSQSPIIEVTEQDFYEKVINPEKDVLIQFYTMKTKTEVSETYEKVAKHYELDNNIVVAKCNVDKYNVPVDVYHVPTTQLFPAYKKNTPVEYFDKPTDLEQYFVFMKEEGTRKPRVRRTSSPKYTKEKKTRRFLGFKL